MKIGIYGYGNLGKAVERVCESFEDISITGIFTRRDPKSIEPFTKNKVYSIYDVLSFKDKIDVMIVCGGSATDLPEMTPMLAGSFNVIDTFDIHCDTSLHFSRVNEPAVKSGHVALISAGWDPGILSVMRLFGKFVIPKSSVNTFWGEGLSQGHSDALRQIYGVHDARAYTVPQKDKIEMCLNGEEAELPKEKIHKRICYIVPEEWADRELIESDVRGMFAYFKGYETEIHFVTQEELLSEHSSMHHEGCVTSFGKTCDGNSVSSCYRVKTDSNPEYTASLLLCYARAVHKMNERGERGAKTVFNIAPADMTDMSETELRNLLL